MTEQHIGNASVFHDTKKNVPWHILAPRRGCFSNHLPLRRVRFLAEHFYIEKNATDHSTATTITELSEADSLKELARLSGAAQLTESVLANAKEMKDLAEKKKQN